MNNDTFPPSLIVIFKLVVYFVIGAVIDTATIIQTDPAIFAACCLTVTYAIKVEGFLPR